MEFPVLGTSRQFAVTQHFGRFRSEADFDKPRHESRFMSTPPKFL
jgi:hypothetical protein